MNETITLLNNKQVISFASNDDNDDDMDIDVKSSTDSNDATILNNEIEEILNRKQPQDISPLLIPNVESVNDIESNILIDDLSPSSILDTHTQAVIPRAVYDYASMVNQRLESPRQNKLHHDVAAILGSSDPPPGFGFLHPRFYYLEQKRPIPLEPLQVWRGYNGHVYFSPIQVQQLESDQAISPAKSTAAQSVPLLRKTVRERSNTNLSAYKNRKSITYKTNNGHSLTKQRVQIGTNTNAKIITRNNELRNHTSVTFNDDDKEEDNKKESAKMWQSVVTCAHVRIKPISKRSQHAIEDLQTLQQEQSLQDPTGYNRQVLPNVRPVPKSKFVYKGLAYKESQKLPAIANGNGNDSDGNALQKPLIAYNLAQAYARYEINAARAKQSLRQPPPTAATFAVTKDQQSQLQTSLDLREMRKRIVRGTTLAYHPPSQSVAWTPGRGDHRSTLGSENAHHRPSTSKSSIPQKQTTIIEMPILTKNINQARDSSRDTQTSEITAAAAAL